MPVQQVVDELEEPAHVEAEAAGAGGLALGGAREDRGALAGELEGAGGLFRDALEVVLGGQIEAAGLLVLKQLALAQIGDHLGEAQRQVGVAHRGDAVVGLREQVVAGEDGHLGAVGHVHGRHAAAGVGAVEDVVMDQRADVHELDRLGERVMLIARAAEGVAHQSQHQRAHALAGGREQVTGALAEDLGADLDPIGDRRAERPVAGVEGGRRAHRAPALSRRPAWSPGVAPPPRGGKARGGASWVRAQSRARSSTSAVMAG
ncbi:hypothetical protein D3C72_922210 [compost metagenome]